MSFEKVAFSRLLTEDYDQTDTGAKISPKARSRKWLYISVCGTFLLIVVLAIAFASGLRLRASSKTWSSCGDSPETARDRNCSFDLISFAWQTPECYDAELVSEFASWNNWTFYADDKFTSPVSQMTALQGNQALFVKWDYHVVHCTFVWRQMHRAYERGWIDCHLRNYHHTIHCQKMILTDSSAAEHLITVARILYPQCTKVEDVKYRNLM